MENITTITGHEIDEYFEGMAVPKDWKYADRYTPCFPTITQCQWRHAEGWEARIPQFTIKNFASSEFAVIDETGNLVGFSSVLP